MTGWRLQRRNGVRNDGVAVRKDGLAVRKGGEGWKRRATVSARSVATWQSMVGHRGVCEVDCFAALAKTRFCLCEECSDVAVHGSVPRGLRGGLLHFVRNDRVAFAMTGWRLQRRNGVRNDGARVRKDALLS